MHTKRVLFIINTHLFSLPMTCVHISALRLPESSWDDQTPSDSLQLFFSPIPTLTSLKPFITISRFTFTIQHQTSTVDSHQRLYLSDFTKQQ